MESRFDLLPLTSARFAVAPQVSVWEWQCDYNEDDNQQDRPHVQESREQLPPPYEPDELAEVWAASLDTDELPLGPLGFVESIWFQSIVGFVIAMNAIIIGVETDVPSQHWSPIENSLLVFFVVELLLRLCHHGVDSFLHSFGNIFDFLIVCAGVFDTWLVPIINFIMGVGQTRRSAFMSVIQMLRLLRIIRLIRLVKIIQPLYRLALGIAEAVQGMFWVLVFLAMMLYAAGIVLTRMVGRDALGRPVTASKYYEGPRAQDVCSGGCSLAALDVPKDQVRVMFQSVPSSIFTLFEYMSSWSLMRLTPLFAYMPMLKLAGVMFYIFAAWALLAVMTGVVSEKMIAAREKINYEAQDREDERSGMAIQALQTLFHRVDSDGSGEVSREEFNAMLTMTDAIKQLMENSQINVQDLNELFEWLDRDKDGVVTVAEFIDGFRWLNDRISPKSFLRLQEEAAADIRNLETKLVDFANDRFDNLIQAVLQPLRKINAVTEQLQRLEIQLRVRGDRVDFSKQGSGRGSVGSPGRPGSATRWASEERDGASARAALEDFEEQVSRKLDELMHIVDHLDELQAAGRLRLVPEGNGGG